MHTHHLLSCLEIFNSPSDVDLPGTLCIIKVPDWFFPLLSNISMFDLMVCIWVLFCRSKCIQYHGNTHKQRQIIVGFCKSFIMAHWDQYTHLLTVLMFILKLEHNLCLYFFFSTRHLFAWLSCKILLNLIVIIAL